MNPKQRLKLVGSFVIAIMVLNLVLFAFGLIHWMTFWGVILVGFLFVWKGLPWLKKR